MLTYHSKQALLLRYPTIFGADRTDACENTPNVSAGTSELYENSNILLKEFLLMFLKFKTEHKLSDSSSIAFF